MIEIKELDIVELKNGQRATVLEVFEQGEAYLVEIADESGKTLDMPTVKANDIKRVTWVSS